MSSRSDDRVGRSPVARAFVTGAIAAVAASIGLATAPAHALILSLSHGDERAAIEAGRKAALDHRGLPVDAYAAYEAPDPLTAQRSGKTVDAIVVGTPYERVLYASYVAAFQNATPAPAAVDDAAAPNSVDMIVFAHSRDTQDQSFLRRFRDPVLSIGGRTLRPVKIAIVGPSKDFFSTDRGRELLWLGDDAFRFDLRGVENDGVDVRKAQARFTITDPYGHAYAVKLDMSKYR